MIRGVYLIHVWLDRAMRGLVGLSERRETKRGVVAPAVAVGRWLRWWRSWGRGTRLVVGKGVGEK